MLSGGTGYGVWESLGYKPVIPFHSPDALIEILPPSASVLEIGCHDGATACDLAQKRPDLTIDAVDINTEAIGLARQRARGDGVNNVRFQVCDALDDQSLRGPYDALVTLRVLTCFAEPEEWRRLIGSIERLLHPGGRWYAIDYLYDAANTVYAPRYEAAEAAGSRRGNFNVMTKAGELMFVAHHHTADEIDLLKRHFAVDRFRTFQSLSMNGNPATMFELVGRRRPVPAMSWYPFDGAPAAMRESAAAFRARFHIDFETLTYFPERLLHDVHREDVDEAELMRRVIIASQRDPEVLQAFEVLSRVANLPAPSLADRADYFAALTSVYSRLPDQPVPGAEQLIVAPEREGRILADSLGWLRRGRHQAPHAKRIPYAHGLLVGIGGLQPVANVERIVVVDGAIASGATIVALLDLLARPGMAVDVYSVHAAREGLRAVVRYGARAGLSIRVHVGHVTDGLSPKFYAVDAEHGGLVVGDLGDTIDGVTGAIAVP
jgi:SAM-dependent methyltransferase